MANNCDSNTYKLISSSTANRSKLLKLADGIKTRKKSSTHKITTSPNNKKNSSTASLLSNVGYDRALTNIEHLVFGTYKARPSTPLINEVVNEDNRLSISSIGSIGSQTNSPISETNENANQSCECRAHARAHNGVDNGVESRNCHNNESSTTCDSTHNKRCGVCVNNENGFDVMLTNDDMEMDSNSSLKEEHSLISALQQLTTTGRSNSKIPQPISKKRNKSSSAVNSSHTKQSSSESLNSLLSNKDINELVGNDLTKAPKLTNGSKPMSKISYIPKPLINANSGLKSLESNKSFDSITDKFFISNNQLLTKKLISPINERTFEMPVIRNLHLIRDMSSSGTPTNQTSDTRFARIRSTIHANKRMPSLYTNQLRRHNSLDTTHKSVNSYQTRLKHTKICSDKTLSNNSRIIKESRITNTSLVKSQFSTFSTESPLISSKSERSDRCERSDRFGVNNQSTFYTKVIDSYSSENNEFIKTKHNSNLQRNRPQVKTPSGRIRVPLKSRSNSVPESKPLAPIDRGVNRASSDSTPNSSQKNQIINDYYENCVTNRIDSHELNEYSGKSLINSKMMRMFIMDEDNIPVSPKKLSKTPNTNTDYVLRQKERKNKEDKSAFKQYLYETYVNKVPSISAQSTPKKPISPPMIALRPRSSSEHHLSSLLLREAQKEAIDDLKKQNKPFNKTSRPWSQIYSESEAKRVIQNLVTTNKPKSENDILTTGVQQTLFDNESSVKKLSSQSPTSIDSSPHDSVLQRFKKTFSLRFSRNGINVRSDSPVQTKLRSSLRSKSEDKPEETHKAMWYDVNHQRNDDNCDPIVINEAQNYQINRKLSNTESSGLKSKLIQTPLVERQFSTPHPIKARDQTHRKSLVRKYSNRSRLRRTQSHPHNFEKWSSSPRTYSRDINSRVSSETESETESLSGNQHSSVSRQSSETQELDEDVVFAEALWDHTSLDPEELSFRAGEVIDISDSSDKDWWWGTINNGNEERCGWFPASFVRMRVNQDDTLEECMTKIADGTLSRTPKKRLSISKLSNEQVRANVVLEIINTERDFVKHLKDVIDGYLKPCRNRTDMFNESRIGTIFSNIEQLYEFQRKFLDHLELAINWEHISSSLIGECFLHNENGFIVYCEFCKNHPLAISELQDLYADEKYVVFFEGCRLIQNMIDISLDGFLLTPIQKICKYPLQLGELLKYTRIDHKDYIPVQNAYACMQRVAQLVNETKRRFESLEQLITLEESFDGWEGLPLLQTCSVLIHSGEVNRLTSSWSKDMTLFLFDHLLICCKKDTGILKRGTYVFRSRIDLDSISSIIDIEDGTKDIHFNIIAKNSFKFYSEPKQKWYLFQTKTVKDKHNWLKAFDDERKRVAEDKQQGFVVTEKDKRGAKMAHLNSLKPKKPRIKRPAKSRRPDTAVVEIALDPPLGFEIDRNRAGSLPSYMHSDKSLINSSKIRQPVIKKNRSNWFHLGSSKKTKSRVKRTLK